MLKYFSFIAVFSAACDLSINPQTQLPFDAILIDTAEGFDATRTFYTVKSTGFYFMHVSAGVPAYQRLNFAIQNSSTSPNLILTHTIFDGELVTSRDDIQFISEGQRLYISTNYPLYSDGMKQTSWSGFRLDDLMDPLVLFRSARTSSFLYTNSLVQLDKLLINFGDGWDTCNSVFIAPKSGIYYFSWSSASQPNTVHEVLLQINGNTYGSSYGRSMIYGGYYDGIDTSSQSVLVKLNTGDVAKLFNSYGPIYSDSNYQLSFTGFLYEPVHSQKIAWTLTYPAGIATHIYGYAKLDFPTVFLNEGSAWNSSLSILRIPVSGTYFLKIAGVANPPSPHAYNTKFNIIVSLNGRPLMNVMEKMNPLIRTTYNNVRSRSLVTTLKQDDELIAEIPSGYAATSFTYDIMFLGFLIQPELTTTEQMQG